MITAAPAPMRGRPGDADVGVTGRAGGIPSNGCGLLTPGFPKIMSTGAGPRGPSAEIPSAPAPPGRIEHLDALRAVAILLVLGAHKYAFAAWKDSGWIGVDLFFVLSGFLVSGLLFGEFRRRRAITVGRFLIRRAFKIYPAFLAMLGTTLAIEAYRGSPISASKGLAELLFVQNYFPSYYGHTWTLAVEVHFYVLLALVLLWASRRDPAGPDPFRALLPAVLAISLACPALRLITAYRLQGSAFDVRDYLCPTHLRLDSFTAGVTISYWYHYHNARLTDVARRWRWAILAASSASLAVVVSMDIERVFILTAGFTLLYLGFGGVLVLCLALRPRESAVPAPWNVVAAAVGLIGVHSYGIYLWHMLVESLGVSLLRRMLGGPAQYLVEFSYYAVASILLGVAMSKLTEVPALKLRDWLFPSRGRVAVVDPAPLVGPAAGRLAVVVSSAPSRSMVTVDPMTGRPPDGLPREGRPGPPPTPG